MANKHSRAGGKFTGSHTTLSPAASMIADIAHRCAAVTRISPGFLKAGLPSVQGKRRVKIINDGSRLLLTVRDNTSSQEVHVYTTDAERVIQILTEEASKEGFLISLPNA